MTCMCTGDDSTVAYCYLLIHEKSSSVFPWRKKGVCFCCIMCFF